MSPTELSLRWLRDQGYVPAVVETFNPFSRTRKDLFGCMDILFLGKGFVGMVQTTSASNASKRVRKVAENEFLGALREANVVMSVHSWRRAKNGRYVLRVINIS